MKSGSDTAVARTATAPEYLAFRLGNEEYGVNILTVQEIRGYEAATAIANAPDYLKGVVNLRGIIVPILDLRIRFGLEAPSYDALTVVIVLNVGGRVIGVVVDSVSDVTTVPEEHTKPAPSMGAAVNTEYLIGIGALESRMLILLDIERLLAAEFGSAQLLAA